MLTMHRTIGEAAILSKTLSEVTEMAYKVFFDSIEAQGRTLLRASLVGPKALVLVINHLISYLSTGSRRSVVIATPPNPRAHSGRTRDLERVPIVNAWSRRGE